MSRESKIEYGQVATICNDIAAGGHKPTYAAIFKVLGGGTYSVVKRHLTQWLEETAASNIQPLPDDLIANVRDWYLQLQKEARHAGCIELDAEWEKLEAERKALEAKASQLLQRCHAAEEQAKQNGHDFSLKTVQLNHEIEKNERLEATIVDLNSKLSNLTSLHQEVNKQLQLRMRELEQEKARHTHELEMAETRARGTEKALLMRHDTEMTGYTSKIADLKKHNDDLQTMNVALTQRYNQARDDASRFAGQAEVLQQHIDASNKIITDLRQKLETALGQAAKAEGELKEVRSLLHKMHTNQSEKTK
jgi:chromosome segregation ATPase